MIFRLIECIAIFVVGKLYYDLADHYYRSSPWSYALLGIVVYFIGGILSYIGILIPFMAYIDYNLIEFSPDLKPEYLILHFILYFAWIFIAFLPSWILYKRLGSRWLREAEGRNNDDGMINHQNDATPEKDNDSSSTMK
jgi:hypothetical protein